MTKKTVSTIENIAVWTFLVCSVGAFTLSIGNNIEIAKLQKDNKDLRSIISAYGQALYDYKKYNNIRVGSLETSEEIHWNNITGNYREMQFLERELGLTKRVNNFRNDYIEKWQEEDLKRYREARDDWEQILVEDNNQ